MILALLVRLLLPPIVLLILSIFWSKRKTGRVKHMIQVDTSQLESWDQTVLTPVANVVDHLLDGTLPEVKVNQTLWDQQSVALVLKR